MENEIAQYETQLAQVQLAIYAVPEGSERNNLKALEADLKEVIKLSKSSLNIPKGKGNAEDDPLTDEYNLFKTELAELEVENKQNEGKSSQSLGDCCRLVNNNEKLIKELNDLQGTKCQAPFTYKWTNDVTYYNAFISQVPDVANIENYNDIEVKVMFTNPTHKEMRPCPYYLKGDCKFNDDKCRYSHGELVLLSSLREYREPIFSDLTTGSQVFAKQEDDLWYRAIVLSINGNNCIVKFESNSKQESIQLHNILPLDLNQQNAEDFSDSDDNSNCELNTVLCKNNQDEDIINRVLSNPPGSRLGEWEKFTKGFGSKMMEKMGYIHGSGLGKNGLGRVEPVPAVILPPGKSLDHCMLLKQNAGNDADLFKAERKLKRLQKKHEAKLKKSYEMEKHKSDIFTFLNTKLDLMKPTEPEKTHSKTQLQNESTRDLNVSSLQLSEEMRKVEKEIRNLNQSLTRHAPTSQAFKIIKEKLGLQEKRLLELHTSERRIRNEQNQRRDMKKLTVF
ncbi:hypothetical protein RUM44_007448 [Polyplax serrata]|uniref:Zinc finger CCCH-type with G patch domain-containing protein n=1 Tax=Polyplax serrata TaxID=468196 RepID=A0ABR1B0R4_POLSC